jgi:TldD protein
MLEHELLTQVLGVAMAQGGQFAEIFVEEKYLNNVFCEDNKIEKIYRGMERGAGIRVVRQGKTSYVYTNDLTEAGLIKAARLAAHSKQDVSLAADCPALTLRSPRIKFDFEQFPEMVGLGERVELVHSANKAAREVSSSICQVTAAVGDLHRKVQIANSTGDLIEDETARIRLIINCVAVRDGIIQTGYDSRAAVSGWEFTNLVAFDEMARKAAGRAVNMLTARPAPAGRMTVVLSSEAGGTMVHEACGHGMEADLVQKGLSVYKNRLGEKVAADKVTVIDDGTIPARYGSGVYDDEGTPTQRTVLIENGILVGYMYDRLTAMKDGRASTGNGRRESYQYKPIPRMTNTYIQSGSEDPADIIAGTKYGLLVKQMGGGQVNTTNGDFVFDVQEGYIIEDGKIKYPVRGATLTGNGPLALKEIDLVGCDLGFAIGVCGKDGQGVPVGDAQPTIRIRELTVGGI